MEFPADPWQHYARTNEWSWHTLVTEHSAWKKSSYFLAYSFIGRISPALLQLEAFDLYYTGCCLLLCWQYYRLARAIGLSERTAMLFVLINVLTFGNNIFGFYRYYGMSSTVFAQLGAVALTRIAIEMACGNREKGKWSKEAPGPDAPSPDLLPPPRAAALLPSPLSLLRPILSACALAALTAFNHAQGIGIAAIGITAVIVWRLIMWRKSMVLWLATAALILSVATVLWYPRNPLIDSLYRPSGWMSPWYGFPLFQPGTPGFDRAWVIIGAFGGLNLLAALWLILRKRIEGWLTLMPVLLLSLPFVAIPFASVLAGSTEADASGYVIAYHRMLFAIPCGLAICAVSQKWGQAAGSSGRFSPGMPSLFGRRGRSLLTRPSAAFVWVAAVLLALWALSATPNGNGGYNRIYNLIMTPSDDLAMKPFVATLDRFKSVHVPNGIFSASLGLSYVAKATGIQHSWTPSKTMDLPPSHLMEWRFWEFKESEKRREFAIGFIPSSLVCYTASSSSGQLSNHWNPRLTNLELLTGPAAHVWLNTAKAKPAQDGNGIWYLGK